MTLQESHLKDLAQAVELLEKPSLTARIASMIGEPIEHLVQVVPFGTSEKLEQVVHVMLLRVLEFVARSVDDKKERPASLLTHKIATAISGAVGGAFGLSALALELPISTAIILRSIADIARSEGEDITELATRLACLEVFALGGPSKADDQSEVGYYAVRTVLGKAVADAAKHIGKKGFSQKGAPAIARLLSKIGARFSSVVSEKIAAQGVPVIGALGGATVNLMFVDHYQDMARGHFIVRRLEREYDPEEVKEEYEVVRNRLFGGNESPATEA